MPSIILFIQDKPPRRLEVTEFKTHVNYLYPDNVAREIPVKVIFSTFSDGYSGAVMVAADRQVLRGEIARAHMALLTRPESKKAG